MEPLFTSEARKNFIIGITEIILQIFDIQSDEKKNTIARELDSLDDQTLLQKKDDIDEYFSHTDEINKSYFYRLIHMEHIFLENEEKKDIDNSLHLILA